jgi:hypothetical protein
MNDKKSIKSFDVFKENPAHPMGMGRRSRNNKKLSETHHLPDGTNREHSISEVENFYVDSREKVSVYREWIHKEFDLSKNALNVLRFILLNLDEECDEIKLSPTLVARECKYKNIPPIINGIIELLDAGLLFRKQSKDPIYFINVNYIFYGSKSKFMLARESSVNDFINKLDKI